MIRVLILVGLGLWAGTTLLLTELRWFARRPLAERLRPYTAGGMIGVTRRSALSVESFREVIAPLAHRVGAQVDRIFGVADDLDRRLARVHSDLDATDVRIRQLGWSIAAFGVGGLVTLAAAPPPLVGLLLVIGGPLLTFLLLELQVQRASARWQRRLFLELPVVSEQIGMLLSAGFSLGAALNRIAARSRGAVATDLGRVSRRVRQGLSEVQALREWADLADVDAVHRLVHVLALNHEAPDLGRLIAEEARSIRREVQRELVEQIERRSQQVWIPVTVATLVPGVIFLAIPFIEAMRLFAGP